MGNPDTQSLSSDRSIAEQVSPGEQLQALSTPGEGRQEAGPDVFERRGSAETENGGDGQGEEGFVLSRSVQDPSEELPIELVSLTDRFVNSLSAKVHNSPPTIDKISSMFQVFYSRAESHIATHISTLASRINRDSQPRPQIKPRGSALSVLTSKRSQDDFGQGNSGRQLLTAEEVAQRRKARKALEYKRAALEEAAERRVCEQVYDKIWRHRTTLDDERDEKLRSKTAALLLVGIDLKDLGVEIDMNSIEEAKRQEANDFLAQARDHLAKMNEPKYPLGKLQQLAAAHKAIVDALTNLLPSSSSADEILPTLIYCLITCPPEGIDIVSNLLFMQRFRSSTKIDGETAYCLTNLEAAISFLENVELSSLRADEMQEGPVKSPSEGPTPSSDRVDPFRPKPERTTSLVTPVSAVSEMAKPEYKEPVSSTLPRPRPPLAPQQRRLSNLFQPPARVFEAANDAVRNTADQSLKNIGATLDNSFNFLFGRLKEMQTASGPNANGAESLLPKTLAEARRLVENPPANPNLTPDEIESLNALSKEDTTRNDPRSTGLTSGGRTPRERSADSARTQGSGRKPGVASVREEQAQTPVSASSSHPLDSVRNFGNTLNPLNHIPGMIKNFGRATPETPGPRALSPAAMDRLRISPASTDKTASPTVMPLSIHIDPPIQRLIDIKDARDLRLGDVAILLEDYKRLASALARLNEGSR